MIANGWVTATAAALLLLFSASCARTSTSSAGASATTGGSGASGAAEMGRGRCEALTGPERDKCLADERVSPAASRPASR
jgi:hypothetical protein